MRKLFLPVISLFFIVIVTFPNAGFANENTKVLVENGYARESIPGTSISSAYMTVSNLSDHNIKLVSASSEVTNRIEIHQHTMVDGLMRMRQRDFVEISAKKSTVFQPSGFHLMIFDLQQPLKANEIITITLHFDDQSSIDAEYTVQGLKQKKHHHH